MPQDDEKRFQWTETRTWKMPFTCPVCNGRGLVPNGFYMAVGVEQWSGSSLTPESCKSCKGEGIVWSES